MSPRTTAARRTRRDLQLRDRALKSSVAARGGLLVVMGPPSGGKSALAAQLTDVLPDVILLQASDNLKRRDPSWHPDGPGGRRIDRPELKLLKAAQLAWQDRRKRRPPTILVVSRFGTPLQRNRAREIAKANDMRFLLVEARSASLRSFRRLTRLAMGTREATQRIDRYERVMKDYVRVSAREAAALPAARFGSVLSALDDAVHETIRRWREV